MIEKIGRSQQILISQRPLFCKNHFNWLFCTKLAYLLILAKKSTLPAESK